MQKISIIGAGLCGSLLAARLAKAGYVVNVYEKRKDMRVTGTAEGRSINLALSDRGLRALASAGIDDDVKKMSIPMYGRMIHDMKGKTRLSKYSGRKDQYINSISRAGLNNLLMDSAESAGATIYFNQNLKVDIAEDTIFRYGDDISLVGDQICIGADGANSITRYSFQKYSYILRFNLHQTFLDYGYKELRIPANDDGGWRIEKNALHIWPRRNFMLIALPNLDGSFTVTLFLPYEGEESYETIESEGGPVPFFEKWFPNVLEHMPELEKDYRDHPVSNLISIRCNPWTYRSKYLLIGDAAHAIVPFYGQGMNAAFEDVYILYAILTRHNGDWGKTMEEYQRIRKPQTDAIEVMAKDNYHEMRDHVAQPEFIKKRELELELEKRYPDRYFSKYSLVTFRPDIPYDEAKIRGERQDRILLDMIKKGVSLDDQERVLRSLES